MRDLRSSRGTHEERSRPKTGGGEVIAHEQPARDSAPIGAVREHDEVIAWRRRQLLRSGFPERVVSSVASDGRYDLHRLIELVERGCQPELAVRILAPLEADEAA
jgi:hypothetical protein